MDETRARIETSEVVKSFEVFLDEHAVQQKVLHDQMMASVRDMCAPPGVTNGTTAAGPAALGTTKKAKVPSNKVSLGTVNSLVLYMSAQQRLVTSLICDIAEGRIGKGTRRKTARLQKKNYFPLKKVPYTAAAAVAPTSIAHVGLKKDEKNGGEMYFYDPRDLLNSLEQN